MTDEITPELFDYLVELAAVEMTPDEAEYLRRQLNNQLKAVRELDRIALADDGETHSVSLERTATPFAPAAHGVSFPAALRPPLREDVPAPSDKAAAILQGAPESDEGYFVVPEIPPTELN